MRLGAIAYNLLERAAASADNLADKLPTAVTKPLQALAMPVYLGTAGAALGGTFGASIGILGGPLTAAVACVNGALMGGGLGLAVGAQLGAAILLD